MSEMMLDSADILSYFEQQLDEATEILIRASDRRAALLDLTAAARSARHQLGVKTLTIEQLFDHADADPIAAGEVRALIRRATNGGGQR